MGSLHRLRSLITRLLIRLFARVGGLKKTTALFEVEPWRARELLRKQLDHTTDEELDKILSDYEKQDYSAEESEFLSIFSKSGLDLGQELRSEKFLREHRKKHA